MPGIRAIGWQIPERRRSRKELAAVFGLDEVVLEKLTIESVAVPGEDDHPAVLGARAAEHALAAAGIKREQLDLVIFAGMTRDYPQPWVGAFGVLHYLGCKNAGGFDLSARCVSIHDALWTATQLINSGSHSTVAVVCAERFDYLLGPPRRAVEPTDALYSAGAACALVTADAGNDIVAFTSRTNPELSVHDQLVPRAGGTRMRLSADTVKAGDHRWYNGMSLQQVADLRRYLGGVDAEILSDLRNRADFDSVDFVAASPLDVPAHRNKMREIGLDPQRTCFTLPELGHIGPADSLLGIAKALERGQSIAPNLIMMARSSIYSSGVAIRCKGTNGEIGLSGVGL